MTIYPVPGVDPNWHPWGAPWNRDRIETKKCPLAYTQLAEGMKQITLIFSPFLKINCCWVRREVRPWLSFCSLADTTGPTYESGIWLRVAGQCPIFYPHVEREAWAYIPASDGAVRVSLHVFLGRNEERGWTCCWAHTWHQVSLLLLW